jgi:hypothetical protein
MIVKFNSQDTDYYDLSKDHLYFVIGIEADDYRIINDHGKPYLYPSDLFAIVDADEPADWITEYGDEG